jgi:hypothetical protein
MKYLHSAWVFGLVIALSTTARAQGFQDELLDHFAGEWVLKGMIAGGESVHDMSADWVLGHQYLRFHEKSREKTADGALAYNATVYFGWDVATERYVCLWLDSTGGGGLSADGFGYAKPNGDALEFLFGSEEVGFFHTTFRYDRSKDSWDVAMDTEQGGERVVFARATMSRQ